MADLCAVEKSYGGKDQRGMEKQWGQKDKKLKYINIFSN